MVSATRSSLGDVASSTTRPVSSPVSRTGGAPPSAASTTSTSRSPSSLAAATSRASPARCVRKRYRTPSGAPCCRTAPAQLPKLNALPRAVIASRAPLGAMLTVSRYRPAGTNCRARWVRELPRVTSIGRGSSWAGSSSQSWAPTWYTRRVPSLVRLRA